MAVLGQKCLCSGKSGCILAKWLYSKKTVVFGQGGCIRANVFVFGESICVRAKMVVFGQK